MSLAEMAAYALKFSPSFKRKATKEDLIPTVDNLCDLANGQAQNGPTGKVGWEGDFLSMGIKTVLRRLLSKYGYLSIEMMGALSEDEKTPNVQQVRDEEFSEAKEIISVDAQTGEVVNDGAASAEAATAAEDDNPFK